MSYTDDELRVFLAENGVPPAEIEEAVQVRKDLLPAEKLREMGRSQGFDDEDVAGAVATIVAQGTALSPLHGQRFFTHDDWVRISDELFKRRERRRLQDPTLVALSDTVRDYFRARAVNDDCSSALARRDVALTRALEHGASLLDIASAALMQPDDVRAVRDAHLQP